MDPRLGGERHRSGPVPPPSPPVIKVWYARTERSSDIDVHGIGVREMMGAGLVDRPSGTGDWLLMCWHHPVTLRAGAEPSTAPCAMLWSPAHCHLYGRADRAWLHSWIHLDGARVRRVVAASGLPLDEPILPFDPPRFERCLAEMHHEIQAHATPDAVILGNLFENLLRDIARAARARRAPIPPPYLAVRRHLEASFAERLALDDLARMAGCSVGHFCAGFKRWFGVSAIDYAITLRLERARVLLADRNRTVADVARAVGYDDLHHFSKLFHKRMGKPPSAARGV